MSFPMRADIHPNQRHVFGYRRDGQLGRAVVLLHGWPQKPETGFDKKTVAYRLRAFVSALGFAE